MKRLLLLSLFLLVGCTGAHQIEANQSFTISNPDGTSISVDINNKASGSGNSSNPAEVKNPPINITIGTTGELLIKIGSSGAKSMFASLAETAQELFTYPMIIGSILLAGGIIIFFLPYLPGNVRKMGLGVSAGGAAIMALSIVLAAYSWLFAIIGGVLMIGAIVFMIFYFMRTEKALEENVEAIEEVKNNVDVETKNKFFDDEKGIVPKKQSPFTRKTVQEIRNRKGLKRKG